MSPAHPDSSSSSFLSSPGSPAYTSCLPIDHLFVFFYTKSQQYIFPQFTNNLTTIQFPSWLKDTHIIIILGGGGGGGGAHIKPPSRFENS